MRGRHRKKRKAVNLAAAPADGKPRKTPIAEMRADAARLGRYFARGYTLLDVRAETGWSKKKLEARLRLLGRISVDQTLAWAGLLSATQADLQVIDTVMWAAARGDAIEQTAAERAAKAAPRYRPATPEQQRVAIIAAMAKAKIRRDVFEIGQSLGIIDKEADVLRIEDHREPGLGLFRTSSDSDADLPEGNLFKPSAGSDVQLPPPPPKDGEEDEPETVH